MIRKETHTETPPHSKRISVRAALRRLAWVIVFVCVVSLAITGFYGMPRQVEMHGYARMTHVTAGGVFAVAMAAWTLLTAHRHRFSGVNWRWLKSVCEPDDVTRPDTAKKCCYWVMLVSAVPLILSVTMNMFSWFTMEQQICVVRVHVWSAVVVSSSVMLYVLSAVWSRCSGQFERSNK
ncbi:MAG: hypothetical protein K9N55_20895 [Phycisphaerae bacterium]|nr:hypothetical protein [Phycisphaerae bacterium]